MLSKLKLFLIEKWRILLIGIMIVIAVPFIIVNIRKSVALPDTNITSLYSAVTTNGVGANGSIDTSDSEQYFVTGTDPNNYVYYSGLVWRIVSIDPETQQIKIVTCDPITTISPDDGNKVYFKDADGTSSHIYQWLNEEFLSDLRDPDKYIVMDYNKWNTTLNSDLTDGTKPAYDTLVTGSVGLLNSYEFLKTRVEDTNESGDEIYSHYLFNGWHSWLLNSSSDTVGLYVGENVRVYSATTGMYTGQPVQPAIVLKEDILIDSGDGSKDNPYVIEGEFAELGVSTKLDTRYNGEYVSYGNQIYRIAGINSQGIKLIMWDYLKDDSDSIIKKKLFNHEDSDASHGPRNTYNKYDTNSIAYYLNNDSSGTWYSTWYNGLTNTEKDMLVKDAIWYLGNIDTNGDYWHYNLAVCTDEECKEDARTVSATVGIPTIGDWFTTYFGNEYYAVMTTKNGSSYTQENYIYKYGQIDFDNYSSDHAIRPVIYLNHNTYITSGTGLESDPYILSGSKEDSSDEIYCSGLAELIQKQGLGNDGILYEDFSDEIFMTGDDPNNYVYYSGFTWRAISINKETCEVKLALIDPATTISFTSENQVNFDSDGNGNTSYAYQWLNEEFLSKLRDPDKYIDTDYQWNFSHKIGNSLKLTNSNLISAAVGLLNTYEWAMISSNNTNLGIYLNNVYGEWLLNPEDTDYYKNYYLSNIISDAGAVGGMIPSNTGVIRPSIVLKAGIDATGTGTSSDPYLIDGELTSSISVNTKLNTRYSGEYVTYGNQLYRIIEKNDQGIKMIMWDYIRDEDGSILKKSFSTQSFSILNSTGVSYQSSSIAHYLNYNNSESWYYSWYNGLSSLEKKMLIKNATWYLTSYSTDFDAGQHYNLAKCLDEDCNEYGDSVKATVGLPTIGELFSVSLDDVNIGTLSSSRYNYWGLMKGTWQIFSSLPVAVRPVIYLSDDTYVVSGKGTESDPFELGIDEKTCTGLAGLILNNGVGDNGLINENNDNQTFITGTDPNNYVYYSGLTWRVVSINPNTCDVKLVTSDSVVQLTYNPLGNTSFNSDGKGNKSYIYQWLNNDFLNNLRNPEDYIVMDADWNMTAVSIQNPYMSGIGETDIVSDTAVGLLNMFEYSMGYNGLSSGNFKSYLYKYECSWLITPTDSTYLNAVSPYGVFMQSLPNNSYNVHPVVNLKEESTIMQGSGTSDDPYVLEGEFNVDPDSKTKLNTRYNGEYIKFGDEIYRIVDKNDQGIKVTSVDIVSNTGMSFDTSGSTKYDVDSTTGIAYNLNNDSDGTWYHTWYNGLTYNEKKMLVQNTTWYQGTYNDGEHYNLAKCLDVECTTSVTSVSATVGLPTIGEWFATGGSNLRPVVMMTLKDGQNTALSSSFSASAGGYFKTLFYLSNDTYITGGLGTESSPYTLKVPEINGKIIITEKIKISDINFEHGNPTFTFKVDGVDVLDKKHTYYRQLTFTKEYLDNYLLNNIDSDYITMDVSIENIVEGTYTVSELITNRYELKSINDVKNGTTDENSVILNISDNNQGEITFIDEKISQNDLSHTNDSTETTKINNYIGLCNTILTSGVGSNGSIDTWDPDQTFIRGTDPNNYVYYSGLIWRVVSINPHTCELKLITQDSISEVAFNPEGKVDFDSDGSGNTSYMYQWLNNNFLSNLRDPEKYIVTDAEWFAGKDVGSFYHQSDDYIVNSPVGLLTFYEYARISVVFTGNGSGYTDNYNYLNTGEYWWLLNKKTTSVSDVTKDGFYSSEFVYMNIGVRPVVVLKFGVSEIGGNGTQSNPYVIEGELTTDINNKTKLNTRYNGEFITYGNQSYRIVDKNEQGIKVILWDYLRDEDGTIITKEFSSTAPYSTYYNPSESSNIGYYLNNDSDGTWYHSWYNGLTDNQKAMLVQNATWYIGQYLNGQHYNLAKCIDEECSEFAESVEATVGLPTAGEWFTSRLGYQYDEKLYPSYWSLTQYPDNDRVRLIYTDGILRYDKPYWPYAIRPVIYISNDAYITGGLGTEDSPYTLGID